MKRLCLLLCATFSAALAPGAARAQDAEPSVETGGNKEATAPAQEPAQPAGKKSSGRSIEAAGASPSDTLVSGQIVGANESEAGDEWKFNFKGFFRAPMRLGFGKEGTQNLQVHSIPVIPDWNYTTWAYTNANPGPWVEMLFQYGNKNVMMTTALASYNITTGSWRELQDQLGIDRAFLTLSYPETFGDRGGLVWNVGVFSNRYGTAGRYDAGAYETYLFARTRAVGETLTANLFLTDDLTLFIEQGVGGKLDQQKWSDRAVGGAPGPYASYEPYPGPGQQGSGLLNHAHVGLGYADMVTVGAHYVSAWVKDSRTLNTALNHPDCAVATCKIDIYGADVKVIGGWAGEGYLGYAHMDAKNAIFVPDIIEVQHSQGGWQLTNNYFGGLGNGKMDTVLFQYRFSLAAFLTRPSPWWGDGADLVAQVFGMFNSISEQEADPQNGPGTKKMKWGADVMYTPLPTWGIGGRFDLVQPNLDNSRQSFAIISPRMVFKTKFVTHEQVILQWSHYSYNAETRLPYPFTQPSVINTGAYFPALAGDSDVVTLAASMWW